MKFLSDILAKAGLTVDGVVTLNNTATGQTPDANDNSTKLATTAWVRTFVQPYSLPIATVSVLGGIKVGSGLSIDSGTGVLSVTGASAATIKSTQTFVVTEGQTVYTVTGGYTPGLIDIFLNGVYLSPNQTVATNGTTFTINDPAAAGDIVDVIVASPIFEGASTTTDQLPEGVVNLYYTNARARAAISLTTTGVSGAATYDNVTGVFNIPNYQGLVPAGGVSGQVLSKVDGNDYNTQWLNEAPAASYTSQLKHRVKSSQAINKGQAVYVSSADGNNMIVSKASNASEATSSKTMGLLESTVSINGTANVITEGLLAGLDTTGANAAGDPVWLGTDGNLIYGLLDKPSAPAHLVFIGVVTRRNANNGEIFVHVQNGFELDELHNLSVKNASDGDMIKYVASTGLWTKIAATTTNITEGTNLYYTQARFDTAFAAKSTSNLTEGTNLYYTTARANSDFDTRLATKSTTNLAEGTNLYYTTARVNSDFDTRLATKSTTNLAEGTNLYYTDARVGTYLTANSYATQSYVSTQINNLVSGAPGLLDTLDELAAALGDDPNFATTVSTALSNRLRIDIGTQGLTSTQQGYGRTNLGLGSLAVLSSVGNAQITDLAYSKLTGVPSTFTPSAHTHPISDITGLQTALNGKQASLSGTGFVKISGTTVSYDNSTYLTTSSAASTYQTILTNPITGTGTATRVAFFDGANTITSSSGFYWDNSAGRLAVGKNTADARLEVYAGTKGQIRANGGPAIGGGVDIYTELSGTGRRNWGLHTEVQTPGDFSILVSASAGTAPVTEVFTIQNTGIGSYKYNLQAAAEFGVTDDKGVRLRGITDSTHRLYYSTTRVGIILEINNTFNIDFYNNGSPSTPFTFTTGGALSTAGTINAGDSVTLQGELYFGGITSNRHFRLVKSGTAESAGILNYQFYTGAGWFTRSTLNSSGNVTYTGSLETGGVAGIGIAPSATNILATGDAGIASSNTRFGTGQVRIGGGSDHGSNVVLSVAPGEVNFDRPGIGGGALKITSTGNVGVNNPNPVQTLSVRGLFGAPVTTGTSQNGIARFGQTSGNGCLDIGFGDPYSWLQSRDSSNYSVNYNLVLQPNGGRVSIGTTNPTQKLNVDGLRGQPATSGTTQNGLFRISTLSTGYGEALDMGFHVGVDGPASYGWIQSTNQGDLSVNYRLMLNPNGGQVFIGTTTALQGTERFAVTSSTNTAILARFTGGGDQGWAAKLWNNGTTGNNLILEFLTESSITARGSVRYDRSGNRLNIVGEGNGILFTGIGSFTGSTASVDSIRLYNTDGNYSYIRTTPASNANNTWFDTPLGATLWLGWDNPGGARTASTYSQVYVGTGRGTTAESVRLHRGDIEGRDGSDNIKYRIVATGAIGSHTFFTYGNVGINDTNPTSLLTITGSNGGGDPYAHLRINGTGAYPNNIAGIALNNSGVQQHIRFLKNGVEKFQMRYNNGSTEDNIFKFYSFITNNDFVAFDANNDNVGIGITTPLSIVNNRGLQIARGGHTMLMLGTGNTHGGVLQSSDDTLRMFMGANFYDDVSNSWSQFVDNRGYAAFDAIGGADAGLARILVGKPNQSGYSGDNVFFEAFNSNSTSYLKLRTATDNALYIANSGKIAIGGNNPSLRLSVLETGTVISGGNVTFASQAQGLEIYNNISGTTDNLVGCWFSTGPHKAGIASGRTNAANWAVDLRFFVHGPEIASLDNTYEKMRLGGDGTLVVTGDVVAYGSPSDIRLKDIKEKVPNALESIKKLNGYRFDWKQTDHLKNIKEDIGVIAQEVADVLPELAKTNEDGFMSVRYQGLTAVLIEAVKEQQTQIESQKSEIEELKDLVKQLINR